MRDPFGALRCWQASVVPCVVIFWMKACLATALPLFTSFLNHSAQAVTGLNIVEVPSTKASRRVFFKPSKTRPNCGKMGLTRRKACSARPLSADCEN